MEPSRRQCWVEVGRGTGQLRQNQGRVADVFNCRGVTDWSRRD